MKSILSFLLLGCMFSVYAQKEITLVNQNGLLITYKSIKLEAGNNKDKYLLSVSVANTTNGPLFYAVKTTKSTTGVVEVDQFAQTFVGKVNVRNASGGMFASDDIKIKGEKTNIFTTNQAQILYKFDADRTYTFENNFSVKSNDTLIVGYVNNMNLKPLVGFDLDMSGGAINGTYKSTCGTTLFNLNFIQENGFGVTAVAYLSVTINNKTSKWVRKSPIMFVKETDQNCTLTLDKTTSRIVYTNSDGIICELMKN